MNQDNLQTENEFSREDEIEEKLDKLLKLEEENSKKLKELYQSMVRGRILRIVYWTLILGGAIGAFYFLQPYIDTLLGVYGQFGEAQSDLRSLFTE